MGERWQEEVYLQQEEMFRSLQMFENRRSVWLKRANRLEADVSKCSAAYARK